MKFNKIIAILGVVSMTMGRIAAQQHSNRNVIISGFVNNSAGIAVDYIKLVIAKDSTIVKTTITDSCGRFVFKDVIAGNYNIICSSDVRYIAKTVAVVANKDTIIDIELMANTQLISPVIVKAKRVKMGADRYSVALKNNAITEGKNIAQVISMLPGMSSSLNNDVLFRGQPLGKIYINGRRVINRDELKAIDASQVSNVDVQYNPNSQDDAQLRGATINIELNTLLDGGYSGSIEGGVAFRPKYGYSSSYINSVFAYQYKKLNIYNYFNINDFVSRYEYEISNKYKTSNSYLNSTNKTIGREPSLDENLVLEYRFNDKHSLGLSLNGHFDNNRSNEESTSTGETNSVPSSSTSTISDLRTVNRLQSTLRYQWNFSDKGSNLILEADYLYNDDKSTSDYNMSYYDSKGDNVATNVKRSNFENPNSLFDVKAQLEFCVGQNGKINTGLRYYSNQTTRNLKYYDFDDHQWEINSKLSDMFTVEGQGAAAYVEYKSQVKRFSYNVGLRYQYDNVAHNSLNQNVEVNKNYSNFFPTASVGYSIDDKSIYLNLSYRRSMMYIPYNEISPAVHFQNEYSYSKGNPDLSIPIENSINFSISVKTFSFWYSYAHVTNEIEYFTYLDSNNPMIKYSMPQNAGITNWHVLGADYSFYPLKCWRMNFYATLTHKSLNYEDNGINKGYQTTVFEGGFNNNLTFKNWGVFVNLFGETKYVVDNKTMLPVFNLSLGTYLYLCNKQLLLKLESQPFISKLRDYYIDNNDFYQYSKFKTSQTNFRLSVKYIFNKGQNIRDRTTEAIQSITTRDERK